MGSKGSAAAASAAAVSCSNLLHRLADPRSAGMEPEARAAVGQANSEQPLGYTPDRQQAAPAQEGGSPSGGSRRDPRTPLSGAAPAAGASDAAGTAGTAGAARAAVGPVPTGIRPAADEPTGSGAAPTPASLLPFKPRQAQALKERSLLTKERAIKRVAAAILKLLLEVRSALWMVQTAPCCQHNVNSARLACMVPQVALQWRTHLQTKCSGQLDGCHLAWHHACCAGTHPRCQGAHRAAGGSC